MPLSTPVFTVLAVVTIGLVRAAQARMPVNGIVPPTPSPIARAYRSSALRAGAAPLLKNLPKVNTSSSFNPRPRPMASVAASGRANNAELNPHDRLLINPGNLCPSGTAASARGERAPTAVGAPSARPTTSPVVRSMTSPRALVSVVIFVPALLVGQG